MYTVELYARVRRAVRVEGRSQRDVAREYGLARKTVRKMLEYAEPPGYQRQKPVRRPKLGPWQGVIDAILEDDKQRPRKQRHTAKRILDRLRAEHEFTGGYTIVKDYVRAGKLRSQEMFVPLTHAPGAAQADFGEAEVVIAGVAQKAHFMVFDLPHSDDCFVRAYPAETTEAFLDAHVHAFAYFSGVPTSVLYDNTKIAVARILGDGTRLKTRAFSSLQSHYLFAEKFGRPARGNDKGKVEGLVGYARRNFMVPIPSFPSWEALNEHFLAACRQRRERRLRGHAAPLAGWELPECFNQLRRLIEARLLKQAGREYIQVLRLLESFPVEEVTAAVEDALRLRTASFDAVRHLLLCRIERKPPRLDMTNWPHLPTAQVRTTRAADYMALLTVQPLQEATL